MIRRILAELKRRQVLRVAGLYAASGWAVFQVVNSLFPALNLPKWSVTLVAALFLIGLPIALVIAYAFERTPEGIQRTAPADFSKPAAPVGWFDWLLLAVSVAIVALAVTQFARNARNDARTAAAVADAGVSTASIAVLPFVSFSDAPDAEYFADGLTEELINSLAQLPDLKVAGRTSAFYFKGRNEDLREVGRKLGVAHVLEGSVRRSAGQLRVTAQLIKVADGFHLWSQTYDRPIDDAFRTQSQIATAVAQVLKARLLDSHAVASSGPARDPRAYQLELVARSHLRKYELAELQAARTLYQQLAELEPDNPRAHAGFAEATILLAQEFLALEFDPARQESGAAVERALAIDPRSADAWRVKGLIDFVTAFRSSEWSYAELAKSALRRALELEPDNAGSLELLARLLVRDGQSEQAIALLQRAIAVDPLSRQAQQLLGAALASQGRFGEARRQYESLIDLYPEFTNAPISLAQMLIAQGKLDEAAARLEDDALIRADPGAAFLLALCYANLGMPTELTATLEAIREPPTAASAARAGLLLRAGDQAALAELASERLATTHDPLWATLSIASRVLVGDPVSARALVPAAMPGLLEDPPRTADHDPIDAILVAYALLETGSPDQAAQIARAVLADRPSPAGEYVPVDTLWSRTLAFSVLGQTDDAIAELRRATDSGFRTLIDFEYFVRLDGYPFMSAVAADPRFKALVAKIEQDNRRMRDALLARRASAALRPLEQAPGEPD